MTSARLNPTNDSQIQTQVQSAPPTPGEDSRPTLEAGSTRITRGHDFAVQGLGALVGATWGDFKLGNLLGRGGMGAVYRAYQTSLDREVAVKVLPPEVAERSELRERFLREARAIAKVTSPNIVQVFHAGSFNGWQFYAMELIEGPDLGRRLADGWRPDVATARCLVLQAARGLAAAARWNIIHRDVKPGNMLITADGTLKLTDFGLVRREGDQQLTVSGQIMGTASYISPEQALGRPCDGRTDLYALGIVYYELLTGCLPFRAENSTAVIYQHIHETAEPIRRINPLVDESSVKICARLMAKAADDRYQNAEQLIADLEAIEAGRPPSHLSPQRRPRLPHLLLICGCTLLLGATGMAFWLQQRAHADADKEAATAELVRHRLVAKHVAAKAAAKAAAEAKHRDTWGRFIDLDLRGTTFRLREITPGVGRIGSPDDEPDRSRDEIMVSVRFTTIWWIQDCEVTQAQWRTVMGSLPEQAFPGDALPVTGITRAQAEELCRRLETLVDGLKVRLPTEAEWEYAAHAGQSGAFAGGRPLAVQAWYAANAEKQLHPTGQFPPNPWGIYDLHGNAAEWTSDLFAVRSHGDQSDPRPVTSGDRNVVKGGAWNDDPEDCRIAKREKTTSASKRIGMRLVAVQVPAALR